MLTVGRGWGLLLSRSTLPVSLFTVKGSHTTEPVRHYKKQNLIRRVLIQHVSFELKCIQTEVLHGSVAVCPALKGVEVVERCHHVYAHVPTPRPRLLLTHWQHTTLSSRR